MKQATKPKRAAERKYKKYTDMSRNDNGRNDSPVGEFYFGFYVTPTEKARIETEMTQIGLGEASKLDNEVLQSIDVIESGGNGDQFGDAEAVGGLDLTEYKMYFDRAFSALQHFLQLGAWRDKRGVK